MYDGADGLGGIFGDAMQRVRDKMAATEARTGVAPHFVTAPLPSVVALPGVEFFERITRTPEEQAMLRDFEAPTRGLVPGSKDLPEHVQEELELAIARGELTREPQAAGFDIPPMALVAVIGVGIALTLMNR